MCMQMITSGFRAYGIYPFNPDSILKERLMSSDKGDSEGNELNSKSSSNDVSDLTVTPIQNPLSTLPGSAIQNPLVTTRLANFTTSCKYFVNKYFNTYFKIFQILLTHLANISTEKQKS